MQPVDKFLAAHPDYDIATLLKASPEADIAALIDLTMKSERDALAIEDDGKIVGVVTARGILSGVAGTPETVPTAA